MSDSPGARCWSWRRRRSREPGTLRTLEAGEGEAAQVLGADLGVPGEGELAVVEEQHAAGDLVGGDPPAQEPADARFVDACVLVGDGAQHDHLPQPFVGDADGPRRLQAGVVEERLLDLHRRDVGTPGLDHLRRAAGPVEASVAVDEPRVAGMEEAVLVEAVLRQHLHVALHQRRAFHRDLPDGVDGKGRARLAVENAYRVPRKDAALTALAYLAGGV